MDLTFTSPAADPKKKRTAWPLLPVICVAILLTGLLLFTLGLLFVWLERGTIFVTLSQGQLFEVVRNVVTAAAAIGLGGTIVVSYRKQVTAEHAQRTAQETLQATIQGLQLNLQSFSRSQESDLRSRYTSAVGLLAEQGRIQRLAGVSSLVELADDWADTGNVSGQASVVRLLALEASQSTKIGADPVHDAIQLIILERLTSNLSKNRHWSGFKFTLRPPELEERASLQADKEVFPAVLLRDLELPAKTELSFTTIDQRLRRGDLLISQVTLKGGQLNLNRIDQDFLDVFIRDSRLLSGKLWLEFGDDLPQATDASEAAGESTAATAQPRKLNFVRSYVFRNTTIGGASVDFQCGIPSPPVYFEECHFLETFDLSSWHFHPEDVQFIDCVFDSAKTIPSDWLTDDRYKVKLTRPVVEGKEYRDKSALTRDEALEFGPPREVM